MVALAALLPDADTAEGRWQSVSMPLPEIDRAELAFADGDPVASAFFFDRAMDKAQAALNLAAEVNARPGDAMDRLMPVARWIGAELGGRPEPSSAYALEFRCPVPQGWPVTVWLVLLRRDRLTGAVLDGDINRLEAPSW
jgi:hypothetical protein